jgi:predicted O-methyltransferase YrrM
MYYPIDPFSLKSLPKWHVKRAVWTAYARFQERIAAYSFSSNAVVLKRLNGVADFPDPDKDQTAVTGIQLSYLIAALRATEFLSPAAVVEVGAYRGATTLALASKTSRPYFAIDPYIGYGGAEDDRKVFQQRVANLPNVSHLHCTSGEAARTWNCGNIGFVFIDAVHDYANTSYDIHVWEKALVSGGLMALHDTDNVHFPGTRKAAKLALRTMDLWTHINDLVILKKR